MIEQEQFHTLPRVELCEAKVGQGRCLGIDELESHMPRAAYDDYRNKIGNRSLATDYGLETSRG